MDTFANGEWKMEQYIRYARIAQSYERTNGVQAMDLIGRKLALGGGGVVEGYFALIAADLEQARTLAPDRSRMRPGGPSEELNI